MLVVSFWRSRAETVSSQTDFKLRALRLRCRAVADETDDETTATSPGFAFANWTEQALSKEAEGFKLFFGETVVCFS